MPRKSNRRELIIQVATNRFLISNYDAVTVDELCALTQSTKGSFYHFFANKEALAVDVVNEVWHGTQTSMAENFNSQDAAKQKLIAEINRVASSYLRDDGKRFYVGCPVGSLALSLRGKSLKLTRRLNFALTHMHQFYEDAFLALLSDQQAVRVSASDWAERFQISLQGLTALGKVAPSSARVKAMAGQLINSVNEVAT